MAIEPIKIEFSKETLSAIDKLANTIEDIRIQNAIDNTKDKLGIEFKQGVLRNLIDFWKSTACEVENTIANATKIQESLKSHYDRQQVLREEWRPSYDAFSNIYSRSFIITKKGTIEDYSTSDRLRGHTMQYHLAFDSICAPTRELAEEIVAIREGKWKPNRTDRWCSCDRTNFNHGWKEGETLFTLINIPGNRLNDSSVYFPSVKQMNRFIKEQKEKEERENKEKERCKLVDELRELSKKIIKSFPEMDVFLTIKNNGREVNM